MKPPKKTTSHRAKHSSAQYEHFSGIASGFGIILPKDETPGKALDRNRRYYDRLALLSHFSTDNVNQSTADTADPVSGTPTSTDNSQGYTQTSNSPVGVAYTNLVNKLRTFIPYSNSVERQQQIAATSNDPVLKTKDHDTDANKCARRIRIAMNAAGIAQNQFPSVTYASDLAAVLQTAPYSQFWKKLNSAPISVQDAATKYPGCLAVFSSNAGNNAGHVAILYQEGGKIYMLGNTEGNLAYNATNWRQNADAVFLPQ